MADDSFSSLIGPPSTPVEGVESRQLSLRDHAADVISSFGISEKAAYSLVDKLEDNPLSDLIGSLKQLTPGGLDETFARRKETQVESSIFDTSEEAAAKFLGNRANDTLSAIGLASAVGGGGWKGPISKGIVRLQDIIRRKSMTEAEKFADATTKQKANQHLGDLIGKAKKPTPEASVDFSESLAAAEQVHKERPFSLGEQIQGPFNKYMGADQSFYLKNESGMAVGSVSIDSLKDGVAEISINKSMGKPLTKDALFGVLRDLIDEHPNITKFVGKRGFDPSAGTSKKVMEIDAKKVLGLQDDELELTKQMADQASWIQIQKDQKLHVKKYSDGLRIARGGELISPKFKTSDELEGWAAENLKFVTTVNSGSISDRVGYAELLKRHSVPEQRFDFDLTYSKGRSHVEFGLEPPVHRFDKNPLDANTKQGNVLEGIPLPDSSQASGFFDPPFLVRKTSEGSKSIVGARFTTFNSRSEAFDVFDAGLRESARILKPDGKLLVKIQDSIPSTGTDRSKLESTAFMVEKAKDYGLVLADKQAVRNANPYMPPNVKSRDAVVNYLVFKKIP